MHCESYSLPLADFLFDNPGRALSWDVVSSYFWDSVDVDSVDSDMASFRTLRAHDVAMIFATWMFLNSWDNDVSILKQ